MYRLASQGVVARAGFAEALHINAELGAERVEARTAELAARLREGLAATSGVTLIGPAEPPLATALTAIAVAGWEPAALTAALWERHRIVARTVAYPPGVRFCTAPFNDETDVDRTLDALRELAREA